MLGMSEQNVVTEAWTLFYSPFYIGKIPVLKWLKAIINVLTLRFKGSVVYWPF